MSTPLTSPAPTPPSGSSNPVSLKSWFKAIADWITGLSPAGSAAHDTEWVPITPTSGYTGTYRYRRIGRGVEVRWHCTTSIPADALVNPLFTLPTAARPGTDAPAATAGAFARPMVSTIAATGACLVRNAHTAAAGSHYGSAFYWVD